MYRNFNSILGACFVALLYSCSAYDVKQDVDPNTIYKRDFELNVNGQKGEGVLVVNHAQEYKIHMRSKGKLDLLTIESCHRSDSFEKASNMEEVTVGRLFWKKKKLKKDSSAFEYIYKPASGIEDVSSCPLLIGGYDEKGRHSWGMIEFESPQWILEAQLGCNGVSSKWKGVSACQSKEGLLQVISFDVPVKISPDPQCPIEQLSPKQFQIEIRKDHCAYVFMESEGQKRIHRLITIGFEKIIFREVLQ